jgi:N-acetylmuramoyl-L-alanine amidase-like protein
VFETLLGRHRINRREAIGLGAAAFAGALLGPRAALAARPALFELALEDEGARATAAGGWHTSGVLHAPRRFDLIGLRWAPGARIEAQVRARRRGGEWSRWVPLAAAHGSDHERLVPGTDPVWTGAADLFQLRLRGRARGLRARFVRSAPAAPRALRARRAQVGAPAIIPRSAWGADSVPPRAAPSYGAVQLAFVHHTVTANDYRPEESASIVLGIARYHRDSNGWNDIGYNFLVDQYGQVFEGRAGGIDQAVVGAQAQGYNSQSTGIACLGTFEAVPFPEAGMESLAHVLGWKLTLHGVPVQGPVTVVSAGGESNRYRSGTPVTFERIAGHRDGDSTSCPGSALYAALADLRVRATRYATPVSSVTLHSAARRVGGGRPTALSGELHFADGSAVAGVPVGLEFLAPGGAWQPVGSAVCGPDGRWTAAVTLPGSGQVRAVFAGDGVRPRLESLPLSITVVPKLTLALKPQRLRAGRAVGVSGTMTPAQATLVECLVERRVGRRWVRVQRKHINVRGGKFATRIRQRRAGLHRISISAPNAVIRRLVRFVR